MASDAVAQARAVLRERRQELGAELREVERALDRLTNGRRPSRRTSGTAKRSTGRGRRGGRSEQFLDALKKDPGAQVSQIAKRLGISPQQGHGIAKRLRERGQIKKKGKGYVVS